MHRGRISQATIDEVHNRLDAVAVVGEYVRLEKKSGGYWGKCPFHGGGQEKTPSMKIDPDRKQYYCFACQKGGGIIGFVMEMDKSGFPEAITSLAGKFGVQIVYEQLAAEDAAKLESDLSRKEQIFELYRRCGVTFGHFLLEKPEGKAALEYLAGRKIDERMISRFKLGYAPANRSWLYGFLQTKGYSKEFLDDSGLFSSKYRGMAFFYGRLMFPICDRRGRAVSFGGRSLPGAVQADGSEPPKYINTRETDAYKKGQILYGLDLALPEIRRTKTVYIAEGYMDVIALHSAGVENSVAPCGTAFTDEQAKILAAWADSAVLVFDSDDAGLKAADKGIVTCRRNGLACSVVDRGKKPGSEGTAASLSDFLTAPPEESPTEILAAPLTESLKDPADILVKYGPHVLKKAMENTIMDFEYLVSRGKTLYDTSVPGGKAAAFAVLFPYLDALSSRTERDACIEAAADSLRIDRDAAMSDYAGRREAAVSRPQEEGRAEKRQQDRPETAVKMNDELFLLTLVTVHQSLYPAFRSSVGMREIEDPAAKELFVALEECFVNGETGTDSLLARITWDALRDFVAKRGVSDEFAVAQGRDFAKMMDDGVKRIRARKLRRRVSEIAGELRLIERNNGSESTSESGDDFQDLIAEKMRLDNEIRMLEGK